MSYSDDLDWLVRNVHVWPGGDHQPWCYVYCKSGERAVSGNCITVIEPCVKIDKIDWLTRRAELQHKPSWEDAPEWANWLAQDEQIDVKGVGGGWFWYECRPVKKAAWDHGGGITVFSGAHGAVIGDWRDTLERRPDMHKATPEIDTSSDRVRETEEFMSKWHDRGKLPPVGVFVDVTGAVVYGDGEKNCEVISHVENCAVIRMSWGLGCFEAKALSPTRTERDVLIEIIVSRGLINPSEIADAILATGFKRDGGAT